MRCDESSPGSRAALAAPPPCSVAGRPGALAGAGPLDADRRGGQDRCSAPGPAERHGRSHRINGRPGRPSGPPPGWRANAPGRRVGAAGLGLGPRLRGVADGVHDHVVLLQRGRAVLLHHRLLQHLADRERLVAQPAPRATAQQASSLDMPVSGPKPMRQRQDASAHVRAARPPADTPARPGLGRGAGG